MSSGAGELWGLGGRVLVVGQVSSGVLVAWGRELAARRALGSRVPRFPHEKTLRFCYEADQFKDMLCRVIDSQISVIPA